MKLPLSILSKIWLIAVLSAVLIVMAGCADSPPSTTTATSSITPTGTTTPAETTTASPTATESPTPTVTQSPIPTTPGPGVFILTPLYNITIEPGDIYVAVKTSNFSIVDKLGQPNATGEGHFIYYLDATPPKTPGIKATTADGTWWETAEFNYSWKNVQDGSHILAVQLVNNDGTPLSPAAVATVPVPVVSPTPSPSETTQPTDAQ